MSESTSPGERLDSWKSIARYLRRDAATVRRWEKSLGLPVHRVGLTGRSVFAYTGEIDAWLTTARPAPLPAEVAPVQQAAVEGAPRQRWRRSLIIAIAVLASAAFLFYALNGGASPEDLRIEVTGSDVIARTSAGVEQWRYRFPATYDTANLSQLVHMTTGAKPGIYFATHVTGRRADEQIESGSVTLLDLHGRPQRAFSFTDQVTLGGKTYGPPWAVTQFAVTETGGIPSVAVAAHHYVWDPGIVTILDDHFRRRGTFVHAGWIEAVRWIGSDRLVIAGFSNARDGGMISLLRAGAMNGQGPEPIDSRHYCQSCGPDRPLRMFVFPRTEVNRISDSRFNRTLIQTLSGGRLLARTIEAPSADGHADAIYEFTIPELRFVSARFSDRYWQIHRMLEAQGRITHSQADCPDRDGPRQLHFWEPATGWRTLTIR